MFDTIDSIDDAGLHASAFSYAVIRGDAPECCPANDALAGDQSGACDAIGGERGPTCIVGALPGWCEVDAILTASEEWARFNV